MQSNSTPSVTLINNRYGNLTDEGNYLTAYQGKQNLDSDNSTIHHIEQNHDSEIIEASQVAHISQELCSSLKRIPSTDPHNQPRNFAQQKNAKAHKSETTYLRSK